jgi:DNA-binding Lrp family transcriptional regulator
MTRPARRALHNLKLDRIDIKILAALQVDGRMTNLKLAERVGLSPTPCIQRVRRLEASGLIVGYGATIDAHLLGPYIRVFTEITLKNHTHNDFLRFEKHLLDERNVVNCYLVAGGYDYLIEVVARDVVSYQDIIEKLLEQEIGIAKFFSYITVKHVKKMKTFPMDIFDLPE